jgi:aminoglycoside 2'-N-acetyltransferase I
VEVRRVTSQGISSGEITQLRALMAAAFADDERGGFSEEDWQHALGGMHFLIERAGRIVSHAAVVERDIRVGDVPLRTGYVEAVATDPAFQRRGLGAAVMTAVNSYIGANFELGALGTGSQPFYERLGWRVWQGPSLVRMPDGDRPTPDEDGYIMVLATPRTPPLDLRAPISCDWRPGDVW